MHLDTKGLLIAWLLLLQAASALDYVCPGTDGFYFGLFEEAGVTLDVMAADTATARFAVGGSTQPDATVVDLDPGYKFKKAAAAVIIWFSDSTTTEPTQVFIIDSLSGFSGQQIDASWAPSNPESILVNGIKQMAMIQESNSDGTIYGLFSLQNSDLGQVIFKLSISTTSHTLAIIFATQNFANQITSVSSSNESAIVTIR